MFIHCQISEKGTMWLHWPENLILWRSKVRSRDKAFIYITYTYIHIYIYIPISILLTFYEIATFSDSHSFCPTQPILIGKSIDDLGKGVGLGCFPAHSWRGKLRDAQFSGCVHNCGYVPRFITLYSMACEFMSYISIHIWTRIQRFP